MAQQSSTIRTTFDQRAGTAARPAQLGDGHAHTRIVSCCEQSMISDWDVTPSLLAPLTVRHFVGSCSRIRLPATCLAVTFGPAHAMAPSHVHPNTSPIKKQQQHNMQKWSRSKLAYMQLWNGRCQLRIEQLARHLPYSIPVPIANNFHNYRVPFQIAPITQITQFFDITPQPGNSWQLGTRFRIAITRIRNLRLEQPRMPRHVGRRWRYSTSTSTGAGILAVTSTSLRAPSQARWTRMETGIFVAIGAGPGLGVATRT